MKKPPADSDLSRAMKTRYPLAWQHFEQWFGKSIAMNEPCRAPLHHLDRETQRQIYILLASSALHTELHRMAGVLFFLDRYDSLLLLNNELRGTSVLMDMIKVPQKLESNFLIGKLEEFLPHAYEKLTRLSFDARKAPKRFTFRLATKLHEQCQWELLQFFAVPAYTRSLELILPYSINFRFRAECDIAAGSAISSQGLLQRFSSEEEQLKALNRTEEETKELERKFLMD